jgi:hypothetical protein
VDQEIMLSKIRLTEKDVFSCMWNLDLKKSDRNVKWLLLQGNYCEVGRMKEENDGGPNLIELLYIFI